MKEIAALKSFYRWLKRLPYISDNPIEYIDAPKVPDRVRNTVTPEHEDAPVLEYRGKSGGVGDS